MFFFLFFGMSSVSLLKKEFALRNNILKGDELDLNKKKDFLYNKTLNRQFKVIFFFFLNNLFEFKMNDGLGM